MPRFTHSISDLYPNPETFNPDNFNADNIAKRHKYAFIGFSGGPRGCIGKILFKNAEFQFVNIMYLISGRKYALLFNVHLIAKIVQNFSLHTDIKLIDIKILVGLTIQSINGFPIIIQPRKINNQQRRCNAEKVDPCFD